MLKETIKRKGADITVLPILGNHDVYVGTIQSFGSPNSNLEINGIKDHWKEWLTTEALEKFSEYGFYSMPIELANGKGVPKGSRAIVMNTNACANMNYFLYGQREDPGGQIAWLEEQLRQVEAEGGVAIMLAHYPAN